MRTIWRKDQSLDCIGLYCPMPIVKTAEKMKQLKEGDVLEVVSDDKGIIKDMPAWCEAIGHEFVGMEKEGGEIRVYVKKHSSEGLAEL